MIINLPLNKTEMKKQFIALLLLLMQINIFGQEVFTSPDNKKRVEIRETADKMYEVTVNSSPHKAYKSIVNNRIYFVTDSFHVVYIAACPGGYRVVVDGKEDPLISDIPEICNFNLNQHWYYLGRNTNYSFYSIDGKEQPRYSYINRKSIFFSPDGTRWAYLAKKEYETIYIIDGVEQPSYGKIERPIIFSGDSKHWAYLVQKKSKWFYIIDGEEQPQYDEIAAEGIIFSSDNTHWVYYAYLNKEWLCVSNEEDNSKGSYNLCDKLNVANHSSVSDAKGEFYFGINMHHSGDFIIDQDYITEETTASTSVEGKTRFSGYFGFGARYPKKGRFTLDFGFEYNKPSITLGSLTDEDQFNIYFFRFTNYFIIKQWFQPYILYSRGRTFGNKFDLDFSNVSNITIQHKTYYSIPARDYTIKVSTVGFGLACYLNKHVCVQGALSYVFLKGNDSVVTLSAAVPMNFKSGFWNYDYGIRIIF
jgi:hypothetical protein